MSSPIPLPDRPAIVIENCTEFDGEKCLVIADLHLGLETELRKKGFRVPSMDEALFSLIMPLADSAENLVILGDIKHSISLEESYERKRIVQFLAKISFLFNRIVLVPGNHDGNIGELAASVQRENISVTDSRGIVLGGAGLFHGHTWPSPEVMSCESVLMGHNHPTLALADSHGVLSKKEAWLKIPLHGCTEENGEIASRYDSIPGELIILPAFNPYLGGVDVVRDGLLGPLPKSLPKSCTDGAHIFLLDGTYMGEIGDIRESRGDIL